MASDPAANQPDLSRTLPAGLTPLELANQLLELVIAGNSYAHSRKKRFIRRSSAVRAVTLILSTASTIILGLQDLDFWTGLGFSFTAVVTVASAVEPFFAWRFRWILMEEAQYHFYKIRDEILYRIASKSAAELSRSDIDELYEEYKTVWKNLSQQWLEHRRHATTGG